jgi:hypothetical protein
LNYLFKNQNKGWVQLTLKEYIMAQIKEFGVNSSQEVVEELQAIGVDLENVPDINILGQAAIMTTGLLAKAEPKYIHLDDFGNPYVVIGGRRKSLAAVVFHIDEDGDVWIDSMVRNNKELQNDTGLKKNDLKLAAKGFGLSSSPFKMNEDDNKRQVVKGFIGKYLATEKSDGSDDITDIDMPIYCYLVKTKPENATNIKDIDEKDSTSKMIAAKMSIEVYLEKTKS